MTRAFQLLFAALCVWWCIVIGLYGFAISVRAHSFYSSFCCSSSDCAPIPRTAVEITPDGYKITLHAGEHPMVTSTVVHIVPFTDTLVSEDGEYHACLYPTQNVMRCMYVPPFGA